MVAQIHSGSGQATPVTAAQFGHFVKDHYRKLAHPWAQSFHTYHSLHVMADTLAQLKAGMDELSCSYIEQHQRVMMMAYLGGDIFFPQEALWTDEDRRILAHNRALVAQGQPPFLKQVNLEWSSSYTNKYGMYDLPPEVLARVDGKAVIDGGGFIGDTLCLFRDLFPHSVKYSFEPGQRNYDYLC